MNMNTHLSKRIYTCHTQLQLIEKFSKSNMLQNLPYKKTTQEKLSLSQAAQVHRFESHQKFLKSYLAAKSST